MQLCGLGCFPSSAHTPFQASQSFLTFVREEDHFCVPKTDAAPARSAVLWMGLSWVLCALQKLDNFMSRNPSFLSCFQSSLRPLPLLTPPSRHPPRVSTLTLTLANILACGLSPARLKLLSCWTTKGICQLVLRTSHRADDPGHTGWKPEGGLVRVWRASKAGLPPVLGSKPNLTLAWML